MANNQLTKIYEMRTLGYDVTHKEFQQLNKDLDALRKAKIALNEAKGKIIDPAELTDVNAKLDAVTKKQAETTSKSTSAFLALSKSYKEAKENVQNLAAEFGAESEQAKNAAAVLQDYKVQLEQINALLKKKPADTGASFSGGNSAELLREQEQAANATGIALSELELKEAEAANAATAWVEAQVLARDATAQLGAEVEAIATPYQQYTGTLQENIRQNLQYKARLKEISAEMKAGTGNTLALAEEEVFLKKASAELGQTIGAQVKYLQAASGSSDQLNAELGIMRNLMRQLSDEEKASPIGLKLAEDITVADAAIKKMDADMGNHQRFVGEYERANLNASASTDKVGNSFSKAFGYIRTAAYILPGIGLAGIFNLLFEGIGALITKLTSGGKAINTFVSNLQNLNEVMKNADKDAGTQITALDALYHSATNANIPMADRLKYVKELKSQFPEFFDGINNEIILNGKSKKSYDELRESILATAKAKAAEAKIAELEGQKLDIVEQNRKANNAAEAQKLRAANVLYDENGVAVVENVKAANEKIIEAQRQAAQATNDQHYHDLEAQQKYLLDFSGGQKVIADAIVVTNQRQVKEKKIGADKLSIEEQNELKRIEASRDVQLAIENKSAYDIENVRKLTFDEEINHLNKVEKINVDALNSKIALLKKKGNLNAEETVQAAQFGEEISSIELDTSHKIQEIQKKRFTEQEKDLKNNLDKNIQLAKDANQLIQDDPNATASKKAQAKVDADNAELAADQEYLNKLSQLNKDYNQEAVITAQKGIEAIKRLKEKDSKEVLLASIQDGKDAANRIITETNINYSKLRQNILDNEKLSADKKAKLIDELNKAQNRTILSNEVAQLTIEVEKTKQLFDKNLVSYDTYQKAVEALNKKKEDLSVATHPNKAGGLAGLLGLGNTTDKERDTLLAVNQAIAASFNFAENAMNSYYESERNNIDQSARLNKQKLDLELEQAKSRATSQAERDALDKKYAALKDNEDRIAFEKNKKIQLQQAKINLATQLSNLAVIAFAPGPANLLTLGLAGQIAYGVQAALAFASYALNTSRINSAKYEYGGAVPTRGGRFGGQSHSRGGTPFGFKGQSFEAEADELAIIRTRNAGTGTYTLSGTHSQIASGLNVLGGGANFQPGAKLKTFDYGGSLGTQLQAPVFVPAMNNVIVANGGGISKAEFQELTSAINNHMEETSKRIDRIEVHQVTSTVTSAQNKQVRQSDIATL